MTKESHDRMINMLRDDSLVWSPDFDSIRYSLADYLEAVKDLIAVLEPEEK